MNNKLSYQFCRVRKLSKSMQLHIVCGRKVTPQVFFLFKDNYSPTTFGQHKSRLQKVVTKFLDFIDDRPDEDFATVANDFFEHSGIRMRFVLNPETGTVETLKGFHVVKKRDMLNTGL